VKKRCPWCLNDPIYIDYHDREWGVPVRDERTLFEFLILEGAQAGLSWLTILRRREAYRQAYNGFDPRQVADYDEQRTAVLLNNSGIIRNRRKIEASINNAGRFLEVQKEFGSFSQYIWKFVDDRPVQNHWRRLSDIPVTSPQAMALSKDLRRRGFAFVGPTIMYSHMQATGMVNDHLVDCFRYSQLREG